MIETTACITVDLQSLKKPSSKDFIKGTRGTEICLAQSGYFIWFFVRKIEKNVMEMNFGVWIKTQNIHFILLGEWVGGFQNDLNSNLNFIFVKQTLFINQPLTMHPLKQHNKLTLRKACRHSHHLQKQECKYVFIKFIFFKIGHSYIILVRKIQDCLKLKPVTPSPCSARSLWFVATQSKYGYMGNGGASKVLL